MAWHQDEQSLGGRLSVKFVSQALADCILARLEEVTRKKAAVASGPKFREETPKKGSNPTTPIAVLHCTI